MWADDQRHGRPAEYRCSPVLNAVDQIAKISPWCNFGTKKGARFSSTIRPMYMKPGSYGQKVKQSITHVFYFFDLQPRFQSRRVQSRTIEQPWGKFADFRPSKFRDTDRAPSDVLYKITPHSYILAKVTRGGVLRP